MSGGYLRYAHLKEASRLIDQRTDEKLRKAAGAVEDGRWWTEDLTRDERAALVAELELLADVIEDARESVQDDLCDRETEELLKAIDYAGAGDYGPDAVAEAWRAYGGDEI